MRMVHYSGILRVAITSIPQLIKTARDGRSQADFAQDLGVSQSTLCRYENGDTNPKAEVIERCMRLVHWGNEDGSPSVDELADKVRAQLSREDQAPLRVALSKLIDGLVAEKDMARNMSQHSN
jgi:transcriptional regulator with XRE-family HTH domain